MNENEIKPHWNCEGCKKTITQGEETKTPYYHLSPQSPYTQTYEIKPFDRVERIKLHLLCSPCSQTQEQRNQQLLDERNPRRPIVNPNVMVENSAVVDNFDTTLHQKTLKELLKEDWDEKLKESGKPWEHPNNKS